jgi:glutamine cyclotransferase
MKKILSFIALAILVACNNEPKKIEQPVNAVKNISYSIVKTYPHDASSYTQGLLIDKGQLFEGTGNYGSSKLKLVDLISGKSIKEITLAANYFGEGVAILHDTIYQLTWKEHKVFVYTKKDFKKIKEFDVPFEGWGLTTDGKNLIVTTGGGDLLFYEPQSFKLIKSQLVTELGTPSFNLNESEFINGFVFVNQYTYPYILKVNPNSGEVVGKIDLSSIWDRIKVIAPNADVPNGIAYDASTNKIYITGKWWPELYEIQLGE